MESKFQWERLNCVGCFTLAKRTLGRGHMRGKKIQAVISVSPHLELNESHIEGHKLDNRKTLLVCVT